MELTTGLREYFNLVGSVVLLTMIFYPFELLAPAERKQPFSKRLINILYVPLFLAVALFFLQPVANAAALKIFTVTGGGILPDRLVVPNSLAHHAVFAFGFAVWWDVWQSVQESWRKHTCRPERFWNPKALGSPAVGALPVQSARKSSLSPK